MHRKGIDLLEPASVLAVVDRVHTVLASRRDARAHAGLADGGLREGELPVLVGLAGIEHRLGAARAGETLAGAWQLILSGALADDETVDRRALQWGVPATAVSSPPSLKLRRTTVALAEVVSPRELRSR